MDEHIDLMTNEKECEAKEEAGSEKEELEMKTRKLEVKRMRKPLKYKVF